MLQFAALLILPRWRGQTWSWLSHWVHNGSHRSHWPPVSHCVSLFRQNRDPTNSALSAGRTRHHLSICPCLLRRQLSTNQRPRMSAVRLVAAVGLLDQPRHWLAGQGGRQRDRERQGETGTDLPIVMIILRDGVTDLACPALPSTA